jgi:hypothetical protein
LVLPVIFNWLRTGAEAGVGFLSINPRFRIGEIQFDFLFSVNELPGFTLLHRRQLEITNHANPYEHVVSKGTFMIFEIFICL